MSKDIKEYLKYYIGREVFAGTHRCELIGINENGAVVSHPTKGIFVILFANIKPILRKLESMEGDEAIELAKFVTDPRYHKHIQIFQIKPNKIDFMDGTMWQGDGVEEYNDCEILFNYLSAAQFHYLLSRGFDLFNLIENGLALDQSTLKQDTV